MLIVRVKRFLKYLNAKWIWENSQVGQKKCDLLRYIEFDGRD